ncbi:5005_t:CDS:2, partial [Paraglomus brasilianum]
TDTTIVSRSKEILRTFDPVVKDTLREEIKKEGLRLLTDAKVTSVTRDQPSGPLKVEFNSNETGRSVEDFDILIWAIGRRPNIDDLNLEAAGVTLAEGHILVDEYQNTVVPNVYALGDVCGKAQLTPVAIAAGRCLANRLFGPPNFRDAKLDYSNIPTVVFHGTCGTVGLTEPQARENANFTNVKIYTSRFTNMYYAMTERKQVTSYKLVVADKIDESGNVVKQEQVVGLHIIGRDSAEILQGFAVAVKMGATKSQFDETVALHPTAAEELVTMR